MLAALAVIAALGAAEERTLVTQSRPTEVRAYRGAAIFSEWDGKVFRLVVSRAGGAPQPLPVPPQDEPFDADIGPGPDGRPTVVIARCRAEGCGLSLLALGDDAPVATAVRTRRITHPTIWRDRVAWIAGKRAVTRRLSGGGTRRLPGPAEVLDVELAGGRLAMTTDRASPDAGVCGLRQVRVVAVGSGRGRLIASQLCGLDGQIWVGPSFDGGWLYFARTCNTQAASCSTRAFGAYRYNLRSRRYGLAGSRRALASWAYAGGGTAYKVALREFSCSDPLGDPCDIVWETGLRFRSVRAPIRQ
jgi:hypothetical protein